MGKLRSAVTRSASERFFGTTVRKGIRAFAAVVFLMATVAVGVGAQQTTADLVGTVTDSSGAVVPGATVTVTNSGTGISQSATSSENGDYLFTLLQVGTYSVKVEAKGFKSFVAASLTLSSGDRARVD